MKNELDLTDIEALVIDMDGVLWRGNTPLPGLTTFFDFLGNHSIPFILATNNASKTPTQYLTKLAGFGVTVEAKHILTSSLATAAYLRRELEPGAAVYVVGQEGLVEAMRGAGFTLLANSSQPASAVVAGIDFSFTYDKLKHAALLIQRGARFVGTNGDLTLPTEEGFLPGTGSILAAIQAATGVNPTVIGKPERLMFDLAVQQLASQTDRTAMLGDRLETDILGGQRAGLKTIMVTTGVDSEETISRKGIEPDAVYGGIDTLVEAWQAVRS